MSRHTSGPWMVIQTESGFFVQQKDGVRLGVAYLPNHVGALERRGNEANARLIAAAPDLLEAVEKLLWHIANPGRNEAHGEACKTDPCDLCFARAAIAKAEGK